MHVIWFNCQQLPCCEEDSIGHDIIFFYHLPSKLYFITIVGNFGELVNAGKSATKVTHNYLHCVELREEGKNKQRGMGKREVVVRGFMSIMGGNNLQF